ncbi:hypothetical protein SAMN06269185_3324 [Natronoarchaeum philippinense]|uniref:Uncharacterized protein n=1 Tax=Natronoarchaeum philippinense TaxID=558529 RepID=A0A285PAM6_NATPI|nr:hypothetical protein [Natronoarchaeum philippinense]SNZ18297.1 hypothetical protein SAMN06269185_3324 [Natronoarchaeum philippinense]
MQSNETLRRCTRCGKPVEDEPYLNWVLHSCRHCCYEADGRFRDGGTYRKWRYFPRWHLNGGER